MYFCNVIVNFKIYLDDKRGSMHAPVYFKKESTHKTIY